MEVRGSDLVSATKCESDPSPQMEPPHNQPWRHKILLLAVVASILEECRVELDFRPELPKYAVLKSVIPRVVSSQKVSIRGGKTDPECALQIEVAEDFTVSDGRRNDGM